MVYMGNGGLRQKRRVGLFNLSWKLKAFRKLSQIGHFEILLMKLQTLFISPSSKNLSTSLKLSSGSLPANEAANHSHIAVIIMNHKASDVISPRPTLLKLVIRSERLAVESWRFGRAIVILDMCLISRGAYKSFC